MDISSSPVILCPITEKLTQEHCWRQTRRHSQDRNTKKHIQEKTQLNTHTHTHTHILSLSLSHTYTHIHACMHANTHTRMHTHACTHKYTHEHTTYSDTHKENITGHTHDRNITGQAHKCDKNTNTHTHTHACTHARTCMHACTHICMYARTHTTSQKENIAGQTDMTGTLLGRHTNTRKTWTHTHTQRYDRNTTQHKHTVTPETQINTSMQTCQKTYRHNYTHTTDTLTHTKHAHMTKTLLDKDTQIQQKH